jgi:hypothetical protein
LFTEWPDSIPKYLPLIHPACCLIIRA